MGQIGRPSPVLLLLAAFSRHRAALDWARQRASEAWGSIVRESEAFEFSQTRYYEPTMGAGLRKTFFAFEPLIDPARLVERKLQTNAWEAEYAGRGGHGESRPLNLDPGYVALHYRHHRWESHPWTFADYQRDDYQQFFSECRDDLHHRLREEGRT
jgi:hypothetical protein